MPYTVDIAILSVKVKGWVNQCMCEWIREKLPVLSQRHGLCPSLVVWPWLLPWLCESRLHRLWSGSSTNFISLFGGLNDWAWQVSLCIWPVIFLPGDGLWEPSDCKVLLLLKWLINSQGSVLMQVLYVKWDAKLTTQRNRRLMLFHIINCDEVSRAGFAPIF
jgi:hypothetical protein